MDDSAKRSRALTWSKEVERRVRDLYKPLYPGVQRAKFMGREDREGHPDLVGLPVHVQVKARARSTVGTLWREADKANQSGGATHLVTQDKQSPVLLTLKLSDYLKDMESRNGLVGGG